MIGDRIISARLSKGYTQTEFARLLGIHKQTLYKYESNIVTNIPSDKVEKMAELTDVSPSYIMGWEDNLDDENAEFASKLFSDSELLENVKMLSCLNDEHKDKVYCDIHYWYSKEGH